MRSHRISTLWIMGTTALALLLTAIPLPTFIARIHPDWLLLLVIYWCLTAPGQVGLFYAWSCGFLIDTFFGTVLGQHALAFVLVSYITLRLQLRIRIFPIWQQALSVFLMLLVYHFVMLWFDGIIGYTSQPLLRLLPTITGGLLWPVLVAILDTSNRGFRR